MSLRTLPLNGAAALGFLGNGESITPGEIEAELTTRGYRIQVAVIHHEAPIVEKPLTKAQAIYIAVDMGIDGFNLSRTTTHPRMCPTGTCEIDPNVWQALVNWCVTTAQGYLDGRYRLPDWWTQMQGGSAGLGYAYAGQLGGLADWLQENPWVVTALSAGLAVYGQYLTTQNVKEEIRKNIPSDLLKKDDMAALTALLSQQGAIPEGKTGIVAAGAQQAATPSWIMPAAIIGGGLLIFMLMRK